MGFVSGSAGLYLMDEIVPTVALGLVCLASLLAERPMMFWVTLETMGEDSPQGQAFGEMWSYPTFRRAFRIITWVWGSVFLEESALQVVIVEAPSTPRSRPPTFYP